MTAHYASAGAGGAVRGHGSDDAITEAIRDMVAATAWPDAELLIDAVVAATGRPEADVRRVYDARFRV